MRPEDMDSGDWYDWMVEHEDQIQKLKWWLRALEIAVSVLAILVMLLFCTGCTNVPVRIYPDEFEVWVYPEEASPWRVCPDVMNHIADLCGTAGDSAVVAIDDLTSAAVPLAEAYVKSQAPLGISVPLEKAPAEYVAQDYVTSWTLGQDTCSPPLLTVIEPVQILHEEE